MKRIVNAFVCFMLCAGTSYAQEFSSWEFTTSEANRLKAGSEAPIDVTEEKSEKTIIYNHSCLKLPYGDYLSKISFRGYHPGKDLRRHLRVWIKNDDSQFERDIDVDVNKMACVFDGDCTIPGGVSSEDRVSLLDIPLDNPFLYTRESWLVLKIECTGETVDDSVYFEAHEDGAGFTPVAVFTIQSPVVHYSGKVVNQEGRPVENANVRFYSEGLEYKAKSDGQGNFKVRIERGNNRYGYEITADGCADYLDGILGLPVGNDASDLNFMVYDAILFKKDEPATIILPTPPDPTLGRFYRFDRYENEPSGESHYFFERENAPQANVPYVVFPDHDFEIHPGDYDTKGIEPGCTRANHPRGGGASITFQGSYQSKMLYYGLENEYLYFLCMSPDCSYGLTESGQPSSQYGRIGAFRASFHIYGAWHGIYRNAPYSFIFNGETTGMSSIEKSSDSTSIFDLQGRRLKAKPSRGVYMERGKKYLTK